jgi:predicted metal-dependent phosphoesterase TrpH
VSAEPLGPAFVDLHTHSTASDGTLPPEQVIEAAERCGLAALALTDHDTIDGVRIARDTGERLGIRVITGVELSAFDADHEVHLLALHVSHLDALEKRLKELRTSRHSRAGKIVEKLNALGVPITLEEVLQQSNGGAVGRPHVARAIVSRGGAAHALCLMQALESAGVRIVSLNEAESGGEGKMVRALMMNATRTLRAHITDHTRIGFDLAYRCQLG